MKPGKRYPHKNGPFSSHAQVPALVGNGSGRVLDLGCAQGDMLVELEKRGWTAIGVEPDETDATEARSRGLDVHHGYLEDVRSDIGRDFDAIVAADVIEHIGYPGPVLDDIRGLLAPSGRFVISVPNIAFLLIRLTLLLGRFDYTDRGPLDRTHLRFFTRRTIVELLEQHGFEVTYVGVTPAPIELIEQVSAIRLPRFLHSINMFFARLLPRLLGYQTLVIAEPRRG